MTLFSGLQVAEPHPKANKDETDSTQTLKTPDILYEWVAQHWKHDHTTQRLKQRIETEQGTK